MNIIYYFDIIIILLCFNCFYSKLINVENINLIDNIKNRKNNQLINRHYNSPTNIPTNAPTNAPTTQLSNEPIDISTNYPFSNFNAFELTTIECLIVLSTNLTTGLTSEESNKRLLYFGKNKLNEVKVESLLSLIIEQFEDRLVQMLLAVACLSSVLAFFENDLHAFVEPIVILGILIINALVGIYQGKSASNSLNALKQLQPQRATVLRDSIWVNDFPAENLVPGDIIVVKVGDKVPADCRLITLKTGSLNTEEGSLTGESMPVSKYIDPITNIKPGETVSLSSKSNMLFGGTMVTNGAGIAVVVSTGMSTEIGQVSFGVEQAQLTHTKTPLAEKLDEFANHLSSCVVIICLLVWVINIPKFSSPAFGSVVKGGVHYAKVAVALGVAAIPEGLPAVITLCLSLGTSRLVKKNIIVRKLPAVETLGCTSVICTDKTGTLTTNQMTVTNLVSFKADRKTIMAVDCNVEGVSYSPFGDIPDLHSSSYQSPTSSLYDIALISSLCNQAEIQYKDGQFVRVGEPTEAALKVLVEKLGNKFLSAQLSTQSTYDFNNFANRINSIYSNNYIRLAILEFNRDRKSMSVLVRSDINKNVDNKIVNQSDNESNSQQSIPLSQLSSNRLLVKGAGEIIINRCNRIKLLDGTIIPITKELSHYLELIVKELATRPLRCLALAYKDTKELHKYSALGSILTPEDASKSVYLSNPSNYINYESNMILVGLVGIKDPARPEVKQAIQKCKDAGIRVMMMTGDSKETAVAIARDVSILSPSELSNLSTCAFTGNEFFSLTEDQQIETLRGKDNKVFCRTEPKHKQQLIKLLGLLDEVTAMTGDGVNDAPALQQSDIGIAMGITGTEVAKNSADMILTNDNFASIVVGIEEGRNIYNNMLTFMNFLISSNIGEVLVMILSTLLNIPEPLTPLHLLWVNLVTDGPPATALGFNPINPNIMKQPPRQRRDRILTNWMLIRYLVTGLYVGVATISAFIWWYVDHNISINQLMHWANYQPNDISNSPTNNPSNHLLNPFSLSNRSKAQTIALTVLVSIEMLKALSAVSLDSSLFKIPSYKNKWLLLSVAIPYALHVFVMYTPILSKIFGILPLRDKDWKVVIALSLPILLLEEILKYIGRQLNRRKRQLNTSINPTITQEIAANNQIDLTHKLF